MKHLIFIGPRLNIKSAFSFLLFLSSSFPSFSFLFSPFLFPLPKIIYFSHSTVTDTPTVNLTADSNAKQVKEWLKSKGFSDRFVAEN